VQSESGAILRFRLAHLSTSTHGNECGRMRVGCMQASTHYDRCEHTPILACAAAAAGLVPWAVGLAFPDGERRERRANPSRPDLVRPPTPLQTAHSRLLILLAATLVLLSMVRSRRNPILCNQPQPQP